MNHPQLVLVGTLAIDDIATPTAVQTNLLGGSVTYAGLAASLFTSSGAVAQAGTDLPPEMLQRLTANGLDVSGVQIREGKTFRWSGRYSENMIDRETLSTEVGNSGDFAPDLPASYRRAPYLMLGNMQPSMQLQVLEQMECLKFVAMDTMNLWINIAREELLEVLKRVTMISLNDEEARLLSGCYQLRDCAEAILGMGPHYVVIKKGEHGSMLFTRDGRIRIVPAYPVVAVADPTGAGDSYAGGFMGYLASQQASPEDLSNLLKALLMGAVVSSFTVETFGMHRLEGLKIGEVEERLKELLEICSLN